MKNYKEGGKEVISTELLGFPVEMLLSDYVEHVDEMLYNSGGDYIKLNFLKCFDRYQEDAEFTENTAKHSSEEFTNWLVESSIVEEDPEWVEEWKDHLKMLLSKLEGNL